MIVAFTKLLAKRLDGIPPSDTAKLLLKDQQTMYAYVGFLYDILKQGSRIDVDHLKGR